MKKSPKFETVVEPYPADSDAPAEQTLIRELSGLTTAVSAVLLVFIPWYSNTRSCTVIRYEYYSNSGGPSDEVDWYPKPLGD